MADDLSDLNVAAPAAGDSVSLGDDAIRDTRRQTVNWAGIEHYLTGEHKIPSGAAEPAAGKSGRLFLNTTNQRLSRDDGTIWRIMNLVPFGSLYTSGGVGLTVSPTFALLQTITVVVPAGALRLIIVGGIKLTMDGASTVDFTQVKFQFDGSDITQPTDFDFRKPITGSWTNAYTMFGVVDSPTAGTKTVTMSGRLSSVTISGFAFNRLLLGIII